MPVGVNSIAEQELEEFLLITEEEKKDIMLEIRAILIKQKKIQNSYNARKKVSSKVKAPSATKLDVVYEC